MRIVNISIWSDGTTDIGETDTMYLRGCDSVCVVWISTWDVDFYTLDDVVYGYYEGY